MHNNFRIITLVAALVFLAIMTVSVLGIKPVMAQLPFGGPAVLTQVCTGGYLYYVGPPALPPGLFFFPVPQFPLGLFVLGMASPVPVPCWVPGSPSPSGYGLPVLFFGS
jgi:hypothetical protein